MCDNVNQQNSAIHDAYRIWLCLLYSIYSAFGKLKFPYKIELRMGCKHACYEAHVYYFFVLSTIVCILKLTLALPKADIAVVLKEHSLLKLEIGIWLNTYVNCGASARFEPKL